MSQPTEAELESSSGFSPLGGLNATDNYALIDPTEVSDCLNFLFDSGLCYTRPGRTAVVIAGLDGGTTIEFGGTVSISGTLHTILIGSNNAIYDYLGVGKITPATTGATFGTLTFNNIASVDGMLLMGNNLGGLINWTPNTFTYDVIASAPYRYVAGHKGRAIAAYQNGGGSSLTNARTFAWSKPGDVTDWLESDGSAGNLAVAEIEDEITGLGVLHDIGVILRSYGIHLAYPTGTLPLPYDVQTFIRRGTGCRYPSTAAWDDELVFFVGEDDVYKFDLQSVIPVGYKIRNLLFDQLEAGSTYNGTITRSLPNGKKRLRYHLTPVRNSDAPHFVFDVMENKWSVHNYSTSSGWSWNIVLNGLFAGIGMADAGTTPSLRYWDAAVATEVAGFIQKYCGVQDSIDTDYTITDALIRNLDLGANPLTLSIDATLGATVTTKTVTITSIGTVSATGKYLRNWLSRQSSVQIAGNDFLVTLTSPAGVNFAMNYFNLRLANASEFRGR